MSQVKKTRHRTKDQVHELRMRVVQSHADGHTQKHIAENYGISLDYVHQILVDISGLEGTKSAGAYFRECIGSARCERLDIPANQCQLNVMNGQFDLARKAIDRAQSEFALVKTKEEIEDMQIADLPHKNALRWGNALETVGVMTVRDFLAAKEEKLLSAPMVLHKAIAALRKTISELKSRRRDF